MSMEEDIAQYFDSQLHQLVADTYDTCRHGGMRVNAAAHMLVSVLMAETMLGLVSTGYTETQCIEMVTLAHREMTRVIDQRKRKPRTNAARKAST